MDSQQATCTFDRCSNLVDVPNSKCQIHRFRQKCSVGDCSNQVYARRLCIRHGGKKSCEFPDCQSPARVGIFCSKHNSLPPSTPCSVEGCTRAAHLMRKCIRHGGGKPCIVENCDSNARARGLCWRHRFLSSDIHNPLTHATPLSEAEKKDLTALLQEWLESEDTLDCDLLSDDIINLIDIDIDCLFSSAVALEGTN
ncbi:hypothetical protein THRCLA_07891 [Thraustotheca clavata]|uniref:WRKY19-like zinc finger domain-containing protein n=1 Tax=Thraustotheca clavata TaxID=74557 RepID=A0A1V9ZC40_9STRA|nr:hypothetical protein THRCLA_07891 [Thraustotheca clavata]